MDQGQPRPPYDCPHEHQFICNRNRTPTPPQRQKLRPWKNRALCWETCEGKLQVRNKSEIQEGTVSLSFTVHPLLNRSYDWEDTNLLKVVTFRFSYPKDSHKFSFSSIVKKGQISKLNQRLRKHVEKTKGI